MSLETDVQVLTQATTDLLSAVNVKKATLDQSVNDAAAQVSLATTQATNAAASAATATTKAGEAAGSAASALAIYGNTAAQQAAVTAAQNAASVAAGHAASASSVVQQDLSGVTAAALHRSPNAVTAMFVYDTSKDSDGGAWTEKCQHTSWYNESINGKWLGAQASEAAARAVSGATTGDYFQLTTDGKFYKLNATSGTTEVFRGNKRDFPRLAAIVAEASNVTIYDLTEPGRPMWMRFVSTTSSMLNNTGGSYYFTSVQALNGVMVVTATTAGGSWPGTAVVNFIKESSEKWRSPTSSSGLTYGVYKGFISDRNSAKNYDNNSAYSVQTLGATNAASMSEMADAPIDPATGLKAPTIAIAGVAGVAIIRPNGSVVVSSDTNGFGSVNLTPKLLAASRDATFYWAQNPSTLGASFALSSRTAAQAPGFGIGNTNGLIGMTRSELLRRSATAATVQKLKNFESDPAKSAVATITNTFNTGHQVGDIRRTYLSDIEAGSVTGPELVTNGTFDVDASGWTPSSVNVSAVRNASGQLEVTNNGSGLVYQAVTVTPNVPHVFYGNFVNKISGGRIYVGTGIGATGTVYVQFTGAGTAAIVFTPTVSTVYVSLGDSAGGTGVVNTYDDLSLKIRVADRSYKAKWSDITGTLTKTAVASAAQLVAYSGFSNSNYLREPYSADLDFGTGEWSASAWVNTRDGHSNVNLIANPEDASQAWNQFGSLVLNDAVAPNGTMTADKLVCPNGSGPGMVHYSAGVVSGVVTFTIRAKPAGYPRLGVRYGWDGIDYMVYATIDLETGVVVNNGTGAQITVSAPDAYGYRTCSFTGRATRGAYNFGAQLAVECHPATSTVQSAYTGDGVSGIHIWGVQFNPGSTAAPYTPGQTAVYNPLPGGRVVSRSFTNGPTIDIGMDGYGKLTATAYDGTTTRTVTTTAAYNTATWLKVRANYTTDGSLAILVNGQEVAVTRGAPLLTLNNSNAVLTIGNSYAADAPFPGSIALLKLSATVPTAEQSVWMYEQEKQMFREGAQVCLPDSGSIVDLTYDDATDKWIAVSAANESEWSGLVRTSVTPVPAGSYTKAAAASGVQLLARSTTSPGVDITIPAYGLREELVKRAESASRLARSLVPFDYVGGFTASTTNGSTSITSVAGLSYPTSYIGARVTGSGIPADTVVTAVSGTTIYLSKAATATATGVQISFTDFILPVGYEAKAVLSAGSVKTEGSTKDYTRLFDGFRESIRFGTAPGYQAAVQIQATRSAA